MKICVKCNRSMEDDMIFCSNCGVKYLTNDLDELIFTDCPVSVAGNFLLMDEERLMVNLTLKNQSDDVVKAVTVRLKCFDQMEDGLEDTVVKLMDLSVPKGEIFGYDVLNPVADKDTRSVKIIIEKVLLEQKGLISTPFSEFTKTDSRTFLTFSNKLLDSEVHDFYAEKSKTVTKNWADLIAAEERDVKLGQKWLHNAKIYKEIMENDLKILNSYSGNPPQSAVQSAKTSKKAYEEAATEAKKIADDVEKMRKTMADIFYPVLIVPQECKRLNLYGYGTYGKPTEPCKVSFEEGAVPDHIDCRVSFISSITLPDGLTVIHNNAFEGCRALRKVVIPSTVTAIGDNAFKDCSHLEEIFIPSSVTRISPSAFAGCKIKIIKQADIDRENYWKEHPEQKQRLEARKERAENEIAELEKQKTPFDEQIKQLNNERRDVDNVPAKIEYEEIQKKIKELSNQYASLGVFKGKEKKAINEQLTELRTKSQEVSKEIEPQQREHKRSIGQKIKDIEESVEYKSIIEQINQNREMIDSVNKEFERVR